MQSNQIGLFISIDLFIYLFNFICTNCVNDKAIFQHTLQGGHSQPTLCVIHYAGASENIAFGLVKKKKKNPLML